MTGLPNSITITIAVLTIFLTFITALKYALEDHFLRTRMIMTSFFLFIIVTLSVSFWEYALDTLPFTIPAFFVGALVGYFTGVHAAERRLKTEGLVNYTQHFAHIHLRDAGHLTWWSVINFYSVMSALVLINLVGLSTVIFRQAEGWAILTSVFGALLLGTIAPYLAHLWSIKPAQKTKSTTSE
jgi:small basic protein